MTIPLKYEDVVAKLALEQEMSASTLGELEDLVEKLNNALGENDALQQRLTVAEQLLSETLPHLRFCKGMGQKFAEKLDGLDFRIDAALKPAEDYNELDDDEDLEVFDDQ